MKIERQPAGDANRMAPSNQHAGCGLSVDERLRLFDAATERQRLRESGQSRQPRDWTRADLYTRG
jgi:hypothetical protein